MAEKGNKCAKHGSTHGGRRQQAGQDKTFYQHKHELPQGLVRPSASMLVDVLQNPLSQEVKKEKEWETLKLAML